MDVKQFTFPPLIGGLSSYRSKSVNNPGYALVLDNFICTTTGVRPRGGKIKHATLGASVVHSHIVHNGISNRWFAVSNGSLYDVQTPASPTNPPPAILSGLGPGNYSSVGFSTAGGQFTIAVNGTASHLHFDGTTWTQPNDITGTTSINFSAVGTYNSRLYFTVKGKPQIAYLPINAKSGAASLFDATAILERGGEFLMVTSWSNDSGDGQDDRWVAWTTNGEVLVYSGLNPSDVSWSIIGRYDIPRPLGKNAFLRVGGDILIETVEGIIPLSMVQTKDKSALSMEAITKEIRPSWDDDVGRHGSSALWSITTWPERNIAVISVPDITNAPSPEAHCYAINLKTGAISRLTNYDVQSVVVFGGLGYIGSSDGSIYQIDTGGSDNGAPYYCHAKFWFDDFGAKAVTKQFHQSMTVYEHATSFNPSVIPSVNYVDDDPLYKLAAKDDAAENVWDIAAWDNAVWQGATRKKPYYDWDSLGREGFCIAPSVTITVANAVTPVVELRELTVTYEEGNAITTSSISRHIDRSVPSPFNPYYAEGSEYHVRVVSTTQ